MRRQFHRLLVLVPGLHCIAFAHEHLVCMVAVVVTCSGTVRLLRVIVEDSDPGAEESLRCLTVLLLAHGLQVS